MKKIQVCSGSLVEWIYWMAVDVLRSFKWDIEYRYVYIDRKERVIDVRKRPVSEKLADRYKRLDACVEPEEEKIFISPDAEDKALCLFHECLEILFDDWRGEYFVPKRWGLKKGEDPILNLEAATWEKLSRAQKNTIKWYLPKGP